MRNEMQDSDFFRNTFEFAAIGMAHLAMDGRWVRVNRKLCEITGYSQAELLALSFQGVTHPDDLARDMHALNKLQSDRMTAYSAEKRYIRKDRSVVWVGVQISFVVDSQGLPVYGISIIQDISARKRAEQDTAISHQRYRALFEQMSEGILLIDEAMRVVAHNHEAERQLEYSSAELLRLGVADIELIPDPQAIQRRSAKVKREGRDDFESIYRTGKGRQLHVEVSVKYLDLLDGQRLFQLLFRDVSEKRHAAHLIEQMAYVDQLTGLANRTLLADRLQQAMAQAQRRSRTLAVAFLDLDGFKRINDQHGHDVGDALLTTLAGRMKDTLRDGDTLARMGGDEFVAVLLDLESTEASIPMLARMLQASAQPVVLGALRLQVSASVGVTFYPQAEDVDADQLLRQADQAMYQAKLNGKNRFHVFDAERDRSMRGQHESLQRLRAALAQGEFILYYQPKVNMRTRVLVGVEALIRWRHPREGLLLPAQFLPLMENHSLYVDVGEWVIRQALTQLTQWRSRGLEIPISVNIGAMQIQQQDFFLRLQRLMAEFPGVRQNSLQLEILETSALEDMEKVARLIGQCASIGVDFAIDDFGTGYSSLTYLNHLPITTIKIDQSFVRAMATHRDNMSILDGILWIMRQLQRTPVAEGVETLEHGRILMDLGCELAQGYGIARPMPAEHLAEWLVRWQDDADWKQVSQVPRTAV